MRGPITTSVRGRGRDMVVGLISRDIGTRRSPSLMSADSGWPSLDEARGETSLSPWSSRETVSPTPPNVAEISEA